MVMFVVVWRSDSPKAAEQAKRRASANARIAAAAAFAAMRACDNPFDTNGGDAHQHALASVVLRHGDRLRQKVIALLCVTGRFAACTAFPEADHGFPFLARAGIVQGAISFDSDMAVHLAETDALWLNKHPHFPTAVQPKAVSESLFPGVPNAFLWMFCLMGCDYTCGLKGFGYKTAKKVLTRVCELVQAGDINFAELSVRLYAL